MTSKQNIFNSDSYQAQFALAIYKRLISREWVTNADVMADYLGLESAADLPCNVTNCDQYGELKKAWRKVRRAIFQQIGDEGIEKRGNLQNRECRYVGDNPNPLEGMMSAIIKKDLADYYQFCQDSAGFFPSSWIEHFFAKTLDLYEIERKKKEGRQIVGSSVDRKHRNIELLPFVYECIRYKNVIEITYHEGFQELATTIVFHPHYLKEYNGRWHVFGHADGKEPNDGFDIPLDRIETKPKILYDAEYVEPREVKYPDFFSDIVGITHVKDERLYSITIRIHSKYMFGLVESKPIHRSQETILPFDKERGYGEVLLTLRPNNEFYGRVLQLGHELEIVSPDEVRTEIEKRIYYMYARYKSE